MRVAVETNRCCRPVSGSCGESWQQGEAGGLASLAAWPRPVSVADFDSGEMPMSKRTLRLKSREVGLIFVVLFDYRAGALSSER